MIKCPFCHTNHVENTLFCNECGTYLQDDDNPETDPLVLEAQNSVGKSIGDLPLSPTPKRSGPIKLYLKIENGLRELEVSLEKAVQLGRLDPLSDTFPEVDLTSVGGLEKGVSRRHARILKREGTIIVEDLGSINGTFINGQKLVPYKAEVINHGDSLQLGQLVIQVEVR